MYNSIQTLVDIINEQRSAKQESMTEEFKSSDLKSWKVNAEKRGLVVRSAVHPDSGESGVYFTAKDKSGNFRGYFDLGKKSGQLKENLQEAAYDRNKMGQLSSEATRLTKDLNSLTEKYGAKKGAILMVSQLEAIFGKMDPEDLKNYKETQMKLVKVTSDMAKMTNAYQPPEKYPLGGRDEKSGRSYSN